MESDDVLINRDGILMLCLFLLLAMMADVLLAAGAVTDNDEGGENESTRHHDDVDDNITTTTIMNINNIVCSTCIPCQSSRGIIGTFQRERFWVIFFGGEPSWVGNGK
jgi:hypothetical protein